MNNFTTQATKQNLQEFEAWKLAAFTAAIAERMFPNYALFSRVTEAGNADVLRMALDKVWEKLCQRGGKVNFETQLERVDAEVPNVDDYDMYGVYPALDASVAVCAAITQMEQASAEEAENIGQLSLESVATYLEVIADPELSDEELVRFINTHELMDQELEFQQQVFEQLLSMKTQQASMLDQLRQLSANEGVSNIGICDDE